MAKSPAVGRHRSADRYSPLSEIRDILASGGTATVKSSAVLAATGGMVAVLGMPATATPVASPGDSTTTAALRAVPAAVTAPVATTPVASDFGTLSFTAVAKPKPKPIVRVVAQPASRSQDRTGVTTTTTTKTKPKSKTNDKPYIPPATGGIIAIAQSLLGIPYVWGGTTRAGFDCSGFTQYVYRQAGISIPRTAEAQRQFARKVTNPVPGDLVFTNIPATHVGIYAGNGMMYDSPTTGKTTGLHSLWGRVLSYGRVG